MLLINGRIVSSILHFPTQFTIVLPQKVLQGDKVPLALVLHDLGKGREQVLYGVRLKNIVEKFQVALLLPEGRRSCFQDMAHGPYWNTFLLEELLPVLGIQMELNIQNPLVIGIGAGALGALRLAVNGGIRFALVDPMIDDVFGWQQSRWSKEMEWQGVFEGQREKWQKKVFVTTKGVLIGRAETLAYCQTLLGGNEWKAFPQVSDELEEKLSLAVSLCMN